MCNTNEKIMTVLSNSGFDRYDIGVISLSNAVRRNVKNRIEGINGIGDTEGSVIVFIFPYYHNVPLEVTPNISMYAQCKDYHLYIREVLLRAVSALEEHFPENKFLPFVDSSPIDEVKTAERAGLGSVGKNGLFYSRTERVGSYCFIGEIVCDIAINNENNTTCITNDRCKNCELCVRSCPGRAISDGGINKNRCLSAISQKKGAFSEEECALLKKGGYVWGCDVCQSVCLRNANVAETFIEKFKSDLVYVLDEDDLGWDEDEFNDKHSEYAYAWRGRDVLLKNILILRQ